MQLADSVFMLLSISSFFTAVLYNKIVSKKPMQLFFIRWSHYTVLCFATLYPFIFSRRYDIYYIAFAILLFLSWKSFKGECPLSYYEKKYMDGSYEMGQDILSHPYVDIVVADKKEQAWAVLGLQINLVFIYVVIRYSLFNIANVHLRYFIIIIALVLFFYYLSYTVIRVKSLLNGTSYYQALKTNDNKSKSASTAM